jgi:DNA-binding NtrC family response regulator
MTIPAWTVTDLLRSVTGRTHSYEVPLRYRQSVSYGYTGGRFRFMMYGPVRLEVSGAAGHKANRVTRGESVKKILVIDDRAEEVRSVFEEILDGYKVGYATTGKEGIARLTDAVGLVFLDIRMPATVGPDPEREGLAVMAEIARRRPGLPVVMFTVLGDVSLALEAGRLGAFSYILKDSPPKHILEVVERALAVESDPPDKAPHQDGLGDILGGSQPMQRLYAVIRKVAPTNLPVLILGPHGSGKGMVAKEIHRASPRRNQPFFKVDMAAVTETLFESEVFGHARGSFSNAVETKAGQLEAAPGGTLFLDEIGTLSLNIQRKLLTFLDEHTITRVGETAPRRIDSRIVAATNENLLERIRKGEFREDLYYRLRQVTIMVPPLSERREDIPVLAAHFLDEVTHDENLSPRTLSADTLNALQAHCWPGNVRDLRTAIKSAAVLAEDNEIRPQDLLLPNEDLIVTVHNLDVLYEQQKEGRTDVTTDDLFAKKYGDEALDYLLHRAQKEAGDHRSAGVLLGLLEPGCSEADFNAFRQRTWRLRQRIASRKASPHRQSGPNGPHDVA